MDKRIDLENKADQNATDCPPQYRSSIHFGPVSGLMSGINSRFAPSRVVTQWHDADRLLIYRCGGSAGIASNSIEAHQLPV